MIDESSGSKSLMTSNTARKMATVTWFVLCSWSPLISLSPHSFTAGCIFDTNSESPSVSVYPYRLLTNFDGFMIVGLSLVLVSLFKRV